MFKIISKYSKTGNLKYISHLDVLRFLQRSIKRAGIKAKYSEGFNPHMKTSFGFPLSLGIESIGEYFEVELNEKIDIDDYINKMNTVLPNEMKILKAEYIEDEVSIMARCKYAQYLFSLEGELNIKKLNELFEKMLNEGVIYIREKKNKKNKLVQKELNTKELLKYIQCKEINNKISIEVIFITNETGSLKVDEFMKILYNNDFVPDYYTVTKIDALEHDMKPLIS